MILPLLTVMGCSDDDTEYYSLEISDNSYTFPAEGGNFTVEVSANYMPWAVSFAESNTWLTKTESTDNTVTFHAVANDGAAKEPVTVTFTAGTLIRTLILSQEAAGAATANVKILDVAVSAISHDGHLLLVGYTGVDEADGKTEYTFYTINTLTDEKTHVLTTKEDIAGVNTMSNTGVFLIGLNAGGNPNDRFVKDGQIHEMTVPAGYKTPRCNDISADGTVIVGCLVRDDGTNYTVPAKWTNNGTPEFLDLPADMRQPTDWDRGGAIASCNADATIFIGRVYGSNNAAVIWKDGNTTAEYIGPHTEFEREGTNWLGNPVTVTDHHYAVIDGWPRMFSDNDKYLALSFRGYGVGALAVGVAKFPALYNIETDEIEYIINDYPATINNGVSTFCTDDGTLFYRQEMFSGAPIAMMRQNGISSPTQPWVESLLGSYVGPNVVVRKYVQDAQVLIGAFTSGKVNEVHFYARPSSLVQPEGE